MMKGQPAMMKVSEARSGASPPDAEWGEEDTAVMCPP